MTSDNPTHLWTRARMAALVVGAVTLAIGLRYFHFIWKNAVNVLYYDQWDFLNPFFQGRDDLATLFLWQHGPHREGLGLIADKFLYWATGWNVRAESIMIGGFMLAGMVLALVLKRKVFGGLGYSDVAIPLIFLSLAQYETLIGTPNPAYSAIPVVLITLYCLTLLKRRSVVRYGSLLLLDVLLIYTGMGIFMGIITIAVFALDCYWSIRGKTSVRVWAPCIALVGAVAALASFFSHYVFVSAVECFEFPNHDLLAYPKFIAVMLTSFLGPTGPLALMTLTGMVILLFCAGVFAISVYQVFRGGPSQGAHLIIAVLMADGLLFAGNASVGRVCLGPAAAMASRYSTLLVPAFLGMYFYLLSFPLPRLRRAALIAFVLVLTPGALREPPGAHAPTAGKRAWSECYLRTEDVGYCDQSTGFKIYPQPAQTGLKGKLEYLKVRKLNLFGSR